MAPDKKQYNSIKELVFEFVKNQKDDVDPDKLAKRVLKYFPDSKWNKSHWSWYRIQITKGKYSEQFSDFIKGKLSVEGRGRSAVNPKVKKLGDVILRDVRSALTDAAKNDEVLYFKLNRWVYSRLLGEEIALKKPIKKQLWESGIKSCQLCDKPFDTLKGVEIHRKDSSKVYSIKNCQLLCRPCHQTHVPTSAVQ